MAGRRVSGVARRHGLARPHAEGRTRNRLLAAGSTFRARNQTVCAAPAACHGPADFEVDSALYDTTGGREWALLLEDMAADARDGYRRRRPHASSRACTALTRCSGTCCRAVRACRPALAAHSSLVPPRWAPFPSSRAAPASDYPGGRARRSLLIMLVFNIFADAGRAAWARDTRAAFVLMLTRSLRTRRRGAAGARRVRPRSTGRSSPRSSPKFARSVSGI